MASTVLWLACVVNILAVLLATTPCNAQPKAVITAAMDGFAAVDPNNGNPVLIQTGQPAGNFIAQFLAPAGGHLLVPVVLDPTLNFQATSVTAGGSTYPITLPMSEGGANVNSLWQGYAPLQVALLTTSDLYWHPYTEGVYAALFFLLDNKADPNIPFPPAYSNRSSHALFWAAYDGRVDLVARMIQAGANVTYHNSDGTTALHEAAYCDFRPDAKNHAGQTPFDVTPGAPACQTNYSDMSDCRMTCDVLKGGVPAADLAAITAGKPLDDWSRDARKCCRDPIIKGKEYSQCCIDPPN
ncbi:hypothetical protein WJX72_010233 [[Myrmecia] bisecta]|uniref:Uncharacterized protein n=1 Tax=[Myrmecia] bisecta TaxID=41462 RepID=A0AAW1R9G0_9CHLO